NDQASLSLVQLRVPLRYIYVSVLLVRSSFFFNDTATTEIYTLSLHDALPILGALCLDPEGRLYATGEVLVLTRPTHPNHRSASRSEEHTSELQSRENLVCRLLLEKKKKVKSVISFKRVRVEWQPVGVR